MNEFEYINVIRNVLTKYREKLLQKIMSSQYMISMNIKEKDIYNISTNLSVKYIIRVIIIKTWLEQNNIHFSKHEIEQLVLGIKQNNNINILNKVPVELELSADVRNIISNLYNDLGSYTITPILHYIISFLYEDSQNKDIRKLYGQFFTQKKYIDLILERIPITEESKVLEPSVGGGSFISEIYSRLLMQEDPLFSKLSYQKKLAKNLYGFDIDEFCVTLSLINMAFQAHDVINVNYNIYNADFLDFEFDKKFDVIVGNPPFNAKLDGHMKEKMKNKYRDITMYDTKSSGTLNTAALFVRKSIDLLNENGYLGFILPSSLLRVHSYKKLRDFILANCTVKSLINIEQAFSGVGLEMIIIILQKRRPTKSDKVELVSNIKNDSLHINMLNYSYLSKWSVFPLYLTNSLGEIADKIDKNTILLEEICEMPRGTAISSKSELFNDNPLSECKEYIPILRGQDIGRYYIKNPELFIEGKLDIFEPKMSLYNKKKILVQNVAKRIVATYDSSGYIALDTINLLIIKNKYKNEYCYKYLLAIINSELMEFYFQNIINNRSKLTIHMDKPYLGRIPIKNINSSSEVISQVDKILQLYKALNKYSPVNFLKSECKSSLELKNILNKFKNIRIEVENQILEEQNILNDLIYQLYEINSNDIKHIKRNLGVNAIRQPSYITQITSLVNKYERFIDSNKINLLKSIL